MTRLRLYPHRTAAEQSVTWAPWWIERNDLRHELPSLLTGWDYASDETVGITVTIDEVSLLDSSGLDSVDDLEILAMADCASVQDRIVAHLPLGANETVGEARDVRLRLPPGRLAGSVRLSAHLVLARASQTAADRVAHHRGARIHSSEPFTLRLEGDASRFPTEPVPFTELGLGNAPWTVLTVYEDLSDSFMGGVRLLVNTEHPIGQKALDPATAPQASPLLRAEIIRILVAKAAAQVGRFEPADLDEDSVGRVLDAMCRYLLNRGLPAAARLHQDDPARFEVLLHEELDPFAGLIQ